MGCAPFPHSLILLWFLVGLTAKKQFCGERPMIGERGSRIVGGTDAKPGAWPWLVSLQEPAGKRFFHLCGGTLFNTEWVVTASHCFQDEEWNVYKWRVVTGANRLSELGRETQIRKIKKLHMHEKYDPETEMNDVAVIQLDKPIVYNDYTQPACFPDSKMDLHKMVPCYVSGWGVTEEGSNEPADTLQEARVNMISTSLCNSSKWYNGAIGDYNLCAGYQKGGVDSCQGDSGGPLMCKDPTSVAYYVVGVTSWGRGCAQAQSPGVYSCTQYFLKWILNAIPKSSALKPSEKKPSIPDETATTESSNETVPETETATTEPPNENVSEEETATTESSTENATEGETDTTEVSTEKEPKTETVTTVPSSEKVPEEDTVTNEPTETIPEGETVTTESPTETAPKAETTTTESSTKMVPVAITTTIQTTTEIVLQGPVQTSTSDESGHTDREQRTRKHTETVPNEYYNEMAPEGDEKGETSFSGNGGPEYEYQTPNLNDADKIESSKERALGGAKGKGVTNEESSITVYDYYYLFDEYGKKRAVPKGQRHQAHLPSTKGW